MMIHRHEQHLGAGDGDDGDDGIDGDLYNIHHHHHHHHDPHQHLHDAVASCGAER